MRLLSGDFRDTRRARVLLERVVLRLGRSADRLQLEDPSEAQRCLKVAPAKRIADVIEFVGVLE